MTNDELGTMLNILQSHGVSEYKDGAGMHIAFHPSPWRNRAPHVLTESPTVVPVAIVKTEPDEPPPNPAVEIEHMVIDDVLYGAK